MCSSVLPTGHVDEASVSALQQCSLYTSVVRPVKKHVLGAGVHLSERQEADIVEALQLVSTGAFPAALDAACADPACVPARAALFKLYLAAAALPEAPGGTALARVSILVASRRDREQASAAVHAMVDALASMDPIHAGWYHAAAARVACA